MHTELDQRQKSQDLYQRSLEVIAHGVNSPVRSFKGLGCCPVVAERGEGAYIWDVDGNRYIDFCGSWGALIHGHAHPVIVKAAKEQMERGSTFGMITPQEERLARKVSSFFPSMEWIRFVSTGTEATMSAIRLARAFTGRDYILKFTGHYHGHQDCLLVQAGSGVASLQASSSAGVPKEAVFHTLCIPFNQEEILYKLFETYKGKIAAVILEPIAANMGVIPPKEGFFTKNTGTNDTRRHLTNF